LDDSFAETRTRSKRDSTGLHTEVKAQQLARRIVELANPDPGRSSAEALTGQQFERSVADRLG